MWYVTMGRYRAIIEEIGTILVEKTAALPYPARNRAEALILDILGRIPASGDFAKGSQLTVYRELISKIHAGFRTITFSEAASEIGYSQAQFARIFRKISGMTFCDYLNRIRISNATTMLRNRQKKFSCTEVAAECGFGTVRNFNRGVSEIYRVFTKTAPCGLHTFRKHCRTIPRRFYTDCFF